MSCLLTLPLTTMTEKPQFKHVPHGTNSPPLEATGEDKPMGASCIAGTQQAGHVSDAEQRQGKMKILLLSFRYWAIFFSGLFAYTYFSFIRLFPWIGEQLILVWAMQEADGTIFLFSTKHIGRKGKLSQRIWDRVWLIRSTRRLELMKDGCHRFKLL